MAAYNVRLYIASGFNHARVPGDVGCLANLRYIDKPAVWERQDKYISTIKIDATWEEVEDCDYCQLSSAAGRTRYFVITAIVMLTPRTAQLTLLYDPLLSNGGVDNLLVSGGWCIRAHPGREDKLYANILPEPWSPSQPLRIIGKVYASGKIESGNDSHNLVICTCNLEKAQEYEAAVAKVSGSTEQLDQVIWPKLPTMTRSPSWVGFENAIYDLPNQYIFDMGTRTQPNQDMIENLNALRAMGIESAIINSYVLPAHAYKSIAKSGNFVTSITGNHSEITEGQALDPYFRYIYLLPESGSSFLFAKTQVLYHKYQITSITSGATAEFNPWDIIDPLFEPGSQNAHSPRFVIFDDPAPGGTSYCRPKYYEGKETTRLEQSVAGMPWLTAGISYEGASGGALTMANAKRELKTEQIAQDYQNESYNLQRDRGIIDTAIQAGGALLSGDIGKTGSALYGGINNLIDVNREQAQYNRQTARRMGDHLFNAQAAARNTAPALAFPVSINASSYFGNMFCFTNTGLQLNDAKRLDAFFSAYGYAVDKPLEKTDYTNRKRYNYIKTSGAQFVENAQPQERTITRTDMEMIQEMFDAGITIYHNTSDLDVADWTYDDNPAV